MYSHIRTLILLFTVFLLTPHCSDEQESWVKRLKLTQTVQLNPPSETEIRGITSNSETVLISWWNFENQRLGDSYIQAFSLNGETEGEIQSVPHSYNIWHITGTSAGYLIGSEESEVDSNRFVKRHDYTGRYDSWGRVTVEPKEVSTRAMISTPRGDFFVTAKTETYYESSGEATWNSTEHIGNLNHLIETSDTTSYDDSGYTCVSSNVMGIAVGGKEVVFATTRQKQLSDRWFEVDLIVRGRGSSDWKKEIVIARRMERAFSEFGFICYQVPQVKLLTTQHEYALFYSNGLLDDRNFVTHLTYFTGNGIVSEHELPPGILDVAVLNNGTFLALQKRSDTYWLTLLDHRGAVVADRELSEIPTDGPTELLNQLVLTSNGAVVALIRGHNGSFEREYFLHFFSLPQ